MTHFLVVGEGAHRQRRLKEIRYFELAELCCCQAPESEALTAHSLYHFADHSQWRMLVPDLKFADLE